MLDQTVLHAMKVRPEPRSGQSRRLCLAIPAKRARMADERKIMIHNDFNELRHLITALPPEQMRQLRDEIDRKLAESRATAPATDQDESDADPLLGLWRDYADEMDEIVADDYRKRREDKWREFDL